MHVHVNIYNSWSIDGQVHVVGHWTEIALENTRETTVIPAQRTHEGSSAIGEMQFNFLEPRLHLSNIPWKLSFTVSRKKSHNSAASKPSHTNLSSLVSTHPGKHCLSFQCKYAPTRKQSLSKALGYLKVFAIDAATNSELLDIYYEG